MKIRKILIVFALLASGTANAAFIAGSIEIVGGFNPIDDGGNTTGVDVATGIDFPTGIGVVVDSAGDLTMGFLTIAAMNGFQFNPALDPSPVTLWSAGGFSFDMDSITISNQSTTNLSLSGSGTISGNAFDPTAGTWEFSANTAIGSTTFSWSSSTLAAVPVPPAVWLFGSGLLGLVGIARRRA